MVTEEMVYEALKDCYDPEIPVNVVDLGLVYDVKVEDGKVGIKMTLTAQGCGMGPMIAEDVAGRVRAIDGVTDADIEMVWDPQWNPSMMSEAAKQKLGFG